MKRRTFITTAVAVPVFENFAQARSSREEKGFKVAAGEGRLHGHIKLKAINTNLVDVKVSGKDTDGQLAVYEQVSVNAKDGMPVHIHHEQDKTLYVLHGSYIVRIGEQQFQARAGDTLFVPPKVSHGWTLNSQNGAMLISIQPAGKLEDFFLALSDLTITPSSEEVALLFEAHGMTLVT